MFGEFGALIFINLIHPFMTKVIGKILVKIPVKIQRIVVNSIIGIIIIDTAISSMVYLNVF